MKSKMLLLVALMVGTASLGLAGSCGVGTLADYIAPGFSCTVTANGNTLTFSNFSYTGSGSGGATAIPASGVAVTPSGEGFMFNAPWNVGNGQSLDSTIGYTVTSSDITDLLLSMGGFFFTDGGTVSVAETTNVPGINLAVFANSGGTVSSASVAFASLSSLNVIKDIAVNGNGGSAAVSVVFNQFSTVPEPASMLLLGSGLVGLAGFVRRQRKTSK